jgi:hypothetical protein
VLRRLQDVERNQHINLQIQPEGESSQELCFDRTRSEGVCQTLISTPACRGKHNGYYLIHLTEMVYPLDVLSATFVPLC